MTRFAAALSKEEIERRIEKCEREIELLKKELEYRKSVS